MNTESMTDAQKLALMTANFYAMKTACQVRDAEIAELRKQLGYGEYIGIPVGMLELWLQRVKSRNWLSLENLISERIRHKNAGNLNK